jgi:hypothetical protein
MSTSPAATQPGLIDTLDSFVDFSDYDNISYQSPSLSPAGSHKGVFARPIKAETSTANTLLQTNQTLSGPSHQYDLYKQQTGIVPGAIATTYSLNPPSAHLQGFNNSFGGFDYLNMGTTDDLFDFNTAPSQGSMTSPELDSMEFDSPSSDPTFFFDSTINPSNIGGQEPTGLSSPPPQVFQPGRVWPGMHQQAALAKQQQQQQQQRQRSQGQQQQQAKAAQKTKSPQANDPLVEQKITQLLNSMRAKPAEESPQNNPVLNISRPKKDEDEMDEDERLLASEEGKKLSSKERRQLRNKVSARAFRSRRKEYITQLEAEIANKVTENGDLRAQNRALVDENKRLTDLTRMLLASPSFSDFLNHLSANPQMVPQSQPQSQAQQTSQSEQQRQLPKDVNPYAAQQQLHNQQIGLAMVPEQVDFSLLNMESSDGFSYQPQVFAVLETPEPIFDASILSGKTSTFVGKHFGSDDDEKDLPVIEQAPTLVEAKKQEPAPIDEEFENNPNFVLYHDAPAPAESVTSPAGLDNEALSQVGIFGGIEPEKALARYELVNSTEEEAAAERATARIQRLMMKQDSIVSRLEMLGVNI